MLKMIKSLFKCKQPQPELRSPQTYRIGIPNDPIPAESLEEMKQFFNEIGFVKRAAYVLHERVDNHEFSYLVVLDLAIPPEGIEEAINDIAQSIISHSKVPYKGRWPMDFGPWNDDVPVDAILEQEPRLIFYSR